MPALHFVRQAIRGKQYELARRSKALRMLVALPRTIEAIPIALAASPFRGASCSFGPAYSTLPRDAVGTQVECSPPDRHPRRLSHRVV